MNIVNVADLVNPETGKTYRQENNELTHKIPLGSIVECLPYDEDPEEDYNEHTGLRLFVVRHDRDCDGTPLYALYMDSPEKYKEDLEFANTCTVILPEEQGHRLQVRGNLFMARTINGIPENSLKLIKPPKEL